MRRQPQSAKDSGHYRYHSRPRGLEYHSDHIVDTATLSGEEIQRIRATYYGLIAETDAQIGRIVEALKSDGSYDETLIVFTVDHGEMLGDHWMFGKSGFFDPAYHIPLIVRDPRPQAAGSRGRVVERMTEAVDVLPTILDWLGRPPPHCDGRSLLPFLHGDTPGNWRDEVFWEFDFRDPRHQHAESALGLTSDQCCLNVLRGDRFKYVHFAGLPPLLFDLQADPLETRDLAGDPAYRDIELAMARRLLSRRMVHADATLANIVLEESGPFERSDLRPR